MKGSDPPEGTYTVMDVAKILNVSYSTVLDLLKTRHLSGHKLNRCWRIYKTSVDRFVSQSYPPIRSY
jgi:excisionase family DNA binding protein